MGHIKSNIRKRSFIGITYSGDVNWDLPNYLRQIMAEDERDKFYAIKEVYIVNQENAERAPPGSGG